PGASHGAAAVSAAARAGRPRDRSRDAARGPGARLAVVGSPGRRLRRRVLRHPVVLCRISAHPLRPQFPLRRRPVGLFEPRRPVVGQLDGAAAPMKSPAPRLAALAGIVLVASGHVGSPDTYFEGAAGPYPVRVIVRSPGVVPGLAQITVRLLAAHTVRRVLVLPVYWD